MAWNEPPVFLYDPPASADPLAGPCPHCGEQEVVCGCAPTPAARDDLLIAWEDVADEHALDPHDGGEPFRYWWEPMRPRGVRRLVIEAYERGVRRKGGGGG